MYDVIIIGGGPSGSTTAYYLAKQNIKVLIVEKQTFPRYCIGESLLPYNMEIFRDMNFDQKLAKAGFMKKEGAIFGESDGENVTRIDFSKGIEPEYSYAYQVPRDQFDEMLLDHALEQGVELLKARVDDLLMENDQVNGVSITLNDGEKKELKAKLVIDASGRKFFMAKKFNLLENDPYINSVAVFALFDGIDTTSSHSKAKKGDIIILAFEHGWFWLIPFSDGRTSVGIVTDSVFYSKNKGRPLKEFFDEMVQKASGRVKMLMEKAVIHDKLHLLHNFSRHTKKVAGKGWVLSGDAAMFVDPVYSAGVLVAMTGAREIARLTAEAIKNNNSLTEETYIPFHEILNIGYDVVLPFIHCFRNTLFQRILFNPPKDSGSTVQMIITVLAGCFFKPELIKEEHDKFWEYMKMAKVTPFKAEDHDN
ncbi:MAG: FAD-dependent oxidoreductase [Spirochaetota bacterium]|nr:FAD-dependent oxidoreductase [Spirochaetota bacterium]